MIYASGLLPMAYCRKPLNRLSMTWTWGAASGGRSAWIGSKRCGSLDGELGDLGQAPGRITPYIRHPKALLSGLKDGPSIALASG